MGNRDVNITSNALFARHALLPQGWCNNVYLEWDESGSLTEVRADAAPLAQVQTEDYVIPGMINLHSHAFQRALAGQTEYASAGNHGATPDSFWSWRELMYRYALRLTPEQVEAIAAQLYVECLRHGYTSVCEFHYLQRDPQGNWYASLAAMAQHAIAAAQTSGIGITMLPVLYTYSGFGEQPLKPEQRRFRTNVSDVLRLVSELEPLRSGQVEIGAAPHSLRAASVTQIHELSEALPHHRPIHIHIAEQTGEVDQCMTRHGLRPVQYLYEHVAVNERFCLVHATHLDGEETRQIAASGAVAGLCPTTEANLGDGLFPLKAYINAGGRIGIGSDSHVSQSPLEELRWLEYGQRLVQRQRNIAVAGTGAVGDYLWQASLAGGAQAAGRPVGALAVGKRADVLVLDSEHALLNGLSPANVLNTLIFCGNDPLVRDVMAGGRWLVRNRQHHAQGAIARRFKQVMTELRQ